MVVTRNVFSHRLTVHRKYDLKVGFWVVFLNLFCGQSGILKSVFVHIIAADSFSFELMSSGETAMSDSGY